MADSASAIFELDIDEAGPVAAVCTIFLRLLGVEGEVLEYLVPIRAELLMLAVLTAPLARQLLAALAAIPSEVRNESEAVGMSQDSSAATSATVTAARVYLLLTNLARLSLLYSCVPASIACKVKSQKTLGPEKANNKDCIGSNLKRKSTCRVYRLQ